MSWKSALIYLVLSIVAGGSTGAGVVATKSIQAQGLNQDQADVRYVTKDDANRRDAVYERQLEEIKREMVRSPVFEERTSMMFKVLEQMRQERRDDRDYLERLVLNRK